ncbi:PO21 protein, partial [Tachuris rubrigastra]|nr:PO21 protein [Tachuris rubrigastra]
KPFDTVSHQHMGLKQKAVDPHIITLVKSMYENIYTCIDTKNEQTDHIHIASGVKQGDPMSLLLFSLAVEPLPCKLEECGKGYQQGGNTVTATAFTDDLVLLSGSWEGLKNNIKIPETFCELSGLRTQGEK